MSDEKKIQEAQTEPLDNSDESGINETFQRIKKAISLELVMIIIIGLLFGIAIKNETAKRINVTDKSFYGKQAYDFVNMQKALNQQSQNQSQNPAPPAAGNNTQ